MIPGINKLKENILLVYGFAAWILSMITTLVISPTLISYYFTDTMIKGITVFFIAAVVVTMLTFSKQLATKTRRVIVLIWTFLILGAFFLFFYIYNLEKYTVKYPVGMTSIVVIGDKFRPELIAQFKRQGVSLDEENVSDVLENYGATYEDFPSIWYASEIRRNGYILISLYLVTIGCFVTFLMLIGFTIKPKTTPL